MSEKPNGELDKPINPDEEVDINLEEIPEDNSVPPEKVVALKTGVKTLSAQKKHWRNEAIDPATGRKWKDIAADAGKINNNAKPPEQKPVGGEDKGLTDRVSAIEHSEEKRKFGYEKNLSPEAVDRIFAYAAGIGKKPAEVLEDPFIKGGLETFNASVNNSKNTLKPSGRAPVVGGKSFNQLNENERRDNWGKITGRG